MDAIFVVAMSINRVIGDQNKIPWHLPKDLEHFKNITRGQIVVMGNQTFSSLGRKPLKSRTNIVITRKPDSSFDEDVYKFKNFKEIENFFPYRKEIYVIGGEQIYRLALKEITVKKIYLTIIHEYFEGDTYFPDIDLNKYKCVKAETHTENGLEFTFTELDLIE
jgi:dihydrofolate reductase